ncbi:acyl-coenzyme A thioesterase 13-like [Crassostrea virginica]|uniref:Acyl-coenzyme A thioesterase 13 n=1 Tax=Crassostrea virginica TaxID=6565 RepID=A0A8B8CRN0_CRAVI|nr:acyl-coenzyme A thioesterase 13-like [Crassostrea virginica]
MSSARNGFNFLKQVVKARTEAKTFDNVLQGIRVISGGEGRCSCEMKVKEDHQNAGGTLHGGVTATLVDMVSTWALMTTGREVPGVSVDLSVSYMKPVRVGEDIVIDADTLKIGKTLAFCSVDIKHKNTGALIAQGKHTKYVG